MGSRQIVVLVLVSALLITFGVSLALRDSAPVSPQSEPARPSGGSDTSATAPSSEPDKHATTKNAADGGATAATADAAKAPLFDRPIRAVAFGWDVLAPGLLASSSADGKKSVYEQAHLEVSFAAASDLRAIKNALAKGGADKEGADIAIIPLPQMVAAYEDLRALEPEIFFVAGWSRGRDAILGLRGSSLLKLPKRYKKDGVSVVAQPGNAATLVSLYMLDLAGVSPKLVKLVSDATNADFVAADRAQDIAAPDGSRVLVTTADARLLVPYVAIAPTKFLDNRRAVQGWLAGWLRGAELLSKDVPKAARLVAAMEGAPETIDLVRQLGQLDFSGLEDNVRRAGLSGRNVVTIDELFRLTWQLWRDAGVITTPTPKVVPLTTELLASLVLESPDRPSAGAATRAGYQFTTDALVQVSVPANGSEEARTAAIKRLALVSSIFADSALKISSKRNKKATAEAIETLASRFGLDPARFQSEPALAKGSSTVIEVLAAP